MTDITSSGDTGNALNRGSYINAPLVADIEDLT